MFYSIQLPIPKIKFVFHAASFPGIVFQNRQLTLTYQPVKISRLKFFYQFLQLDLIALVLRLQLGIRPLQARINDCSHNL